MPFGLAEVGVIAAAILERFRLELAPGYRLQTRQMPTIGPRHGMPMVPRAAKGGVGGPNSSPPWPRERYLPTFTVSTPEPSPLERKSPAHWATKRLLPRLTRQLVV